MKEVIMTPPISNLGHAQVSNSHLTGYDSDFITCTDLSIHYKGSSFDVHTQLISWKCPTLYHFFHSIALEQLSSSSPEQQLRALQSVPQHPNITTTRPTSPTSIINIPLSILPCEVAEATPANFQFFLTALYQRDTTATTTLLQDHSLSDIEAVLHLARYFGAPDVLSYIDQCLYYSPSQLPLLHSSSPIEWAWACGAFELATKFRLTCCTSKLLGWALLTLSRGGRGWDVPVWYDADERLRRLSDAMDSELKALAFDAYTWISSDARGGGGGRGSYCRDCNVHACFVSYCLKLHWPEIYQINNTDNGTTYRSGMNHIYSSHSTSPNSMSKEAERLCRASLKKSEAYFLHLLPGIKWGLTPVFPYQSC